MNFSFVRATCPAHLTHLNLITLIKLSGDYKLWSYPLYRFFCSLHLSNTVFILVMWWHRDSILLESLADDRWMNMEHWWLHNYGVELMCSENTCPSSMQTFVWTCDLWMGVANSVPASLASHDRTARCGLAYEGGTLLSMPTQNSWVDERPVPTR
jgi:hypothetical protein